MMRGISRAGRAIAGGLVAAAILGLVLCAASSALVALTGATVGIPGFFMATTALGRFVFTPDWGAVALIVSGATAVGAAMAARRS